MLQTVDAAVIPQWEEAAVDLATTAVCGSSFFCAAAADAEITDAAADLAMAATAACGSSFCCAAAAVSETMDADADLMTFIPVNS